MFDDILNSCGECKKLGKFLDKEYGKRLVKFGATNVDAAINIIEKLSKNVVDAENGKEVLRKYLVALTDDINILSDYLNANFPGELNGDSEVHVAIKIMNNFVYQQSAKTSARIPKRRNP